MMKKLLAILVLMLVAITANAQYNNSRGIPSSPTDSNMKGDVDGDRVINITDVMMIVDYILGHTNNNFIASNADYVRDGTINITDGMAIIDYILGRNNNDSHLSCHDPSSPGSHSGHTEEAFGNCTSTESISQ